MANCESLEKCPFFNDKMAKKNVLAYVYKQRFCKGDNADCARYVVMKRLGKGKVPLDLYPNEMAKARKIVSEASDKGEVQATVCEYFEKCNLFESGVGNLPSTSKAFQEKFCNLNNTICARYMVFVKLGKECVPEDLFPNERGRALKLIDSAA